MYFALKCIGNEDEEKINAGVNLCFRDFINVGYLYFVL